MKLGQQVPSLELCQQLKEAGYPQGDSYFVLVRFAEAGIRVSISPWRLELRINLALSEGVPREVIAAPLASELGEALPLRTMTMHIDVKPDEWLCYNATTSKEIADISADTEANARAKCWLWLKENGYLE